jgi:hypothetical protein
MLMESMNLDVNFGKDATAKHTVYTDMEVQRYAESLTLEYVNKVKLNARIVRLGELIGQGMDFNKRSAFINLVLAAVTGRPLELSGDGLESEWFVHLLDAAYGVIKAQFTKDTVGEIFSLAYEQSITHLSIAYKLQELEPSAKEISFVETGNNLPPLRLHKPAPNLAKIGWRPRMELDKAMMESIVAAKLYVMQNEAEAPKSADAGGNVVNKIRSFLTLASTEPIGGDEAIDAGPVSRLIAERKRQEEARLNSLDAADSQMKSKWRQRQRTPGQRFQAWIWANFLDTRTNFGFLRRVTPLQFLTYIVMFVILLVVYLGVISPLLVLARNVVVVNMEVHNLDNALKTNNLAQVYTNIQNVNNAIAESKVIVDRYHAPATVLALEPQWAQLVNLLGAYQKLTEGIVNITYAVQPLADYTQVVQGNLKFRSSSDNYLTVGTTFDYSTLLDELNARKSFAEVGTQKYQQAKEELQAFDLSFIPGAVRTPFVNFNQRLSNLSSFTSYKELAQYGGDLLGSTEPRTYLFVLLDNSRPMPLGGRLSAFMLLTVQKGSISEARVQSIDVFTPSLASLPQFALDEINLRALTAKTKDNIAVSDLAYISDPDTFADVAKPLWGAALSRKVDALVLLNYEALDSVITSLGGVEIDAQQFKGGDLLNNLVTLQTQNQTVARRDDVAAQLLANAVVKISDNIKSGFTNILPILSDAAMSKGVIVPRNDLSYNKAVESRELYGNLIENTDMPIYLDFVSDSQVVSPTRYPAFNQVTRVQIQPDSSATYEMIVKFPAISNIDGVGICLPLLATDIQAVSIPDNRVKETKANNLDCVSVDVIAETELTFKWRSLPIESSTDPEYNLALGQAKVAGTQVIPDFEISLAPGLNFKQIKPQVSPSAGKILFTDNLQKDLVIQLTITK